MLLLLRQLRRLELRKRSGRYFLYAIGEVILVVVGILIALQINNWNEERKDRIVESNVLHDLVENLELNIDTFEGSLGGLEIHEQSADIIFSALEDPETDLDSLKKHWFPALRTQHYLTLSNGGYESLKNAGFAIINRNDLKKEIVNLHEKSYRTMVVNQTWMQKVVPVHDEFLNGHFLKYEDNSGRWLWEPRDFSFIANSEYFLGLMYIARRQRYALNRVYSRNLQETQRVLELIQAELAN